MNARSAHGLILLAIAALLVSGCGGNDEGAQRRTGDSQRTAAENAAPNTQTTEVAAPTTELEAGAEAPESQLREVQAIVSEFRGRETTEGVIITLPEQILFDFNKATLRPDATSALRKVSQVLKYYADAPARVGGHTDSKGATAYNLDLSKRRASAVRDRLVSSFGIDEGRLTVQGFGESQPIASNTTSAGADDPEGRQRNRRVEVLVRGVRQP